MFSRQVGSTRRPNFAGSLWCFLFSVLFVFFFFFSVLFLLLFTFWPTLSVLRSVWPFSGEYFLFVWLFVWLSQSLLPLFSPLFSPSLFPCMACSPHSCGTTGAVRFILIAGRWSWFLTSGNAKECANLGDGSDYGKGQSLKAQKRSQRFGKGTPQEAVF